MRLDFNAIEEITLDVVMKDDEKTELHITAPAQKMITRLKNTASRLKEIFAKKDEKAIETVWELSAELMSFNLEGIVLTAEELKGKYRMNETSLVIFLQHYVKFVKEINSAKN